MIRNKDETQECKDKKLKDKKNTGYQEPKDPLTEKAPRHSAAALKRDADIISDDVAVVPSENKEKTVAQEASVKDFEKKAPEKDKEQIGESVTLRFDDSEKFVNAAFEFDPNLPLDFDEDSFIVSVPNEKVNAFRELMREKGIEEMPYINKTEKKIAEVQSKRSNRALEMDNSKKATKIASRGDEKHFERWLRSPQLSDIIGVDDGEM